MCLAHGRPILHDQTNISKNKGGDDDRLPGTTTSKTKPLDIKSEKSMSYRQTSKTPHLTTSKVCTHDQKEMRAVTTVQGSTVTML